jgi:hypothetical protein
LVIETAKFRCKGDELVLIHENRQVCRTTNTTFDASSEDTLNKYGATKSVRMEIVGRRCWGTHSRRERPQKAAWYPLRRGQTRSEEPIPLVAGELSMKIANLTENKIKKNQAGA